jgi:uncharacterized protein YeaO (DUF488 family)
MKILLKRAYEEPDDADGFRVLVDRLWPRGKKKADLRLDMWAKDVSPSTELRKWFGHDPARWLEFCRRYKAELTAPEITSTALPQSGCSACWPSLQEAPLSFRRLVQPHTSSSSRRWQKRQAHATPSWATPSGSSAAMRLSWSHQASGQPSLHTGKCIFQEFWPQLLRFRLPALLWRSSE